MTHEWAKAADLITNSPHNEMGSLVIIFAEDSVRSESRAESQEETETLAPKTPRSRTSSDSSPHSHIFDHDGYHYREPYGGSADILAKAIADDLDRKVSQRRNDEDGLLEFTDRIEDSRFRGIRWGKYHCLSS